MSEKRQYDNEYKVQAVKLSKKIGAAKSAKKFDIPINMLYSWVEKAKHERLTLNWENADRKDR